MPRLRLLPTVAILLTLTAIVPADVVAQRRDDPVDAARVLATIDRAVGYLKRTQNARGGWNEATAFPGGVSSLATLALLNAGLDSSDPTVAKGIDYLRGLEPDKTYVVALQTMVFCEADPDRHLIAIQKNVDWLEKAQHASGGQAGAWGYSIDHVGSTDPSNSQFALLALYEAQQAGARVKPATWRTAAAYWRKIQNKDGSWSYPSKPASGSMTCAGIGAMVIAKLASGTGDARVEQGKALCCQPHDDDEAVERGLAWLGRNFSVRRNPAHRTVESEWHYYYLYGLERVGRLTARRFIGDHDWYREGTEQIVRMQDSLNHSWQGRGSEGFTAEIPTSFALLFLAKGRRPILMGKLSYGEDDENGKIRWNVHRRDTAHLTEAAVRAWDLPMTHQVVDPERATVDDLLQSPVLYVSGSDTRALLPQAEKLRDYIDRGGFLFAESSCAKEPDSRRGIERLVEAMFPEPEYRLRQVRPAHPLWRMERIVRGDSPYAGSLWAVEYGCRTCVVFCDRDLSCYWELNRPAMLEGYPKPVQERVADAEAIGLNVLAYATNREPRGKEQQFVEKMETVKVEVTGARGVIQIAKLRHTGGCNDAPGALANLLRAAGQGETKLSIAPDPQLLGPDDPALKNYHFAFMHGRQNFRFSPAERRELQKYLENGGTLLADAICASRQFADGFRRELSLAMEGRRLERIPADDPLFTAGFGGFDIRNVEVRTPQPTAIDEPLAARTRKATPQLWGLRIDGRWAVVFSPLDLSCALESHEAIQCRGYRREDAVRIGLNVLLYSINQ